MHMVCTTSALIYYQSFTNGVHPMCTSSALCVTLSLVSIVILPPTLKVHDSRSGIKKEDQKALNVISKCSKYTETDLKLISKSQDGPPLDIEQLLVWLIAEINYLQDEYAALFV